MTTITRTYQYRCYPNVRQAKLLRDWQYECWQIQRALIFQRRHIIGQRGIDVAIGREDEPRDSKGYLPFAKEPQDLRDQYQFIHQHRGARQKRVIATKQMPRDKKGRPRINWAAQSAELTAAAKAARHSKDPATRAAWAMYSLVPNDCLRAIIDRVEQAFRKYAKQANAAMPMAPRFPRLVGLDFLGEDRGTSIVDPPPSYDRDVDAASTRFTWWIIAGTTDKKFGRLQVRMHRPIPEGAVILQTRINQKVGEWHISFVCELPAPAPKPANNTVHGVDLNVKRQGNSQEVAALADGRIYLVKDSLRKNEQRLARLQKRNSPKRTTNGTALAPDPTKKRYKRRQMQIAKLHQTIARPRVHTQHYIAKRIVDTAGVIGVEDIRWSNLSRKPKKKKPVVAASGAVTTPEPKPTRKQATRALKRGLNKALHSAAPARLVSLITQKAEVAGRRVVKVSARYTSQTCSTCGVRSPEKLSLRVRAWICSACGANHHRDVNAAKNIRTRTIAHLANEELSLPICDGRLRGEDTLQPGTSGETRVSPDTPATPVNREGTPRPARGSRRRAPTRRNTPNPYPTPEAIPFLAPVGTATQRDLWDDLSP